MIKTKLLMIFNWIVKFKMKKIVFIYMIKTKIHSIRTKNFRLRRYIVSVLRPHSPEYFWPCRQQGCLSPMRWRGLQLSCGGPMCLSKRSGSSWTWTREPSEGSWAMPRLTLMSLWPWGSKGVDALQKSRRSSRTRSRRRSRASQHTLQY